MKIISATLIFISATASLYYLFVGWVNPDTLVVYNKANIPRWGIQLWASILGASGLLLLFPQTFKAAGVLMILNSLFTIGCFIATNNLRGGFIEFVFLQIPVFLLWAGYPISVFEKWKSHNRFNQNKF